MQRIVRALNAGVRLKPGAPVRARGVRSYPTWPRHSMRARAPVGSWTACCRRGLRGSGRWEMIVGAGAATTRWVALRFEGW